MRKLLFIAFVTLCIHSMAQTILRIDFTPVSPDNLEVRIQHGLDQIGYTSFINYHSRRESESYDFLLQYEFKDDKILFRLFDSEKILLKTASVSNKPGRNANNIEQAIKELFNQKVHIDNDDYPRDGARSIEVLKYDSAQYFIEVQGPSNSTENEVQLIYLRIARFLTGTFETYHENRLYQSDFEQWKSTGYIKGIPISSGPSFITMIKAPKNYAKFIQLYSQRNRLEEINAPNDKARVYFLQNVEYGTMDPGFYIIINEKWRAYTLASSFYTVLDFEPGTYEFAIQSFSPKLKKRTNVISVNLTKGEVYAFETLLHNKTLNPISIFDMQKTIKEMERCTKCETVNQ